MLWPVVCWIVLISMASLQLWWNRKPSVSEEVPAMECCLCDPGRKPAWPRHRLAEQHEDEEGWGILKSCLSPLSPDTREKPQATAPGRSQPLASPLPVSPSLHPSFSPGASFQLLEPQSLPHWPLFILYYKGIRIHKANSLTLRFILFPLLGRFCPPNPCKTASCRPSSLSLNVHS